MSVLVPPMNHSEGLGESTSIFGRKRVGDDENASQAPKKKRLMGRTLGVELQEIDNNSVSNQYNGIFYGSFEPLAAGERVVDTAVQSAPAQEDRIEAPLYDAEATLPSSYGCSTNGKRVFFLNRPTAERLSYERLIAQRSEDAAAGKAQQDYYGINIHKLISESEETSANTPLRSEPPPALLPSIEDGKARKRAGLMWTEKYRAKKFVDLVGDERTHRNVLRWLKAWDPIVFPGAAKLKVKDKEEEDHHRKILMLTGPPGLGKTTLAHVCAKQAGYEVVEINASDERSRDVVKNKIRDCVGTENVKGVNVKSAAGSTRRPGKPVCLIVDEVDGVVSGNSGGGGEGGFMKALIDLVVLDQKNSKSGISASNAKKGKKGDNFRMLRPLILICNDVYHSSLRPLRSAGLAEIVHVRKPGLDKVIDRIKSVFEKEGVPCDSDAARRICEHTWGVNNRKEGRRTASSGDGDMRSVLVVSEWAAAKLRATSNAAVPRLTKQWVDANVTAGTTDGQVRGLGRGGAREAAERVFIENAGFVKGKAQQSGPSQFKMPSGTQTVVTDTARHEAMQMLREAIETTGEHDRVIGEVFASYPSHPFQDDTFLTKPNQGYEWLHFHDSVSAKVFKGQEWELMPYQSTSALGFHYLFGTGAKHAKKERDVSTADQRQEHEDEPLPFTGPRADFEASEALKETTSILEGLQKSLNMDLHRMFQSSHDLAIDLLPQLIRMLTPSVKPVVVGGKGESMASVRRECEKQMLRRAVEAMGAVGVTFERLRIDDARAGNSGWIYRMEPALDSLSTFETLEKEVSSVPSARYALRQVMDQEHQRFLIRRAAEARQARFRAGAGDEDAEVMQEDTQPVRGPLRAGDVSQDKIKKDFFGRVINTPRPSSSTESRPKSRGELGKCQVKTWVTFNEGFSNAVKKPVSLKELLEGL